MKKTGKRKIIHNISWMLISRVINIASGVLVSIVVTRYLGAEQKGIMANVVAIATFFSFLASFGLGDILIKEFSKDKNHSKEIAASAMSLMFLGGCLAFLFAFALSKILNVEKYILSLVLIYASMYFFQFCKVFEYWFYSQAESRIYTIGQFFIHIFCLLLRVMGTFMNAGLVWFILCSLIENIFLCLILVICYNVIKNKMQGQWKVKKEILVRLLKPCLPIMITGLATSVYMKVDQIMIGKMMENAALGIYSVAVNLAEYWYFVPAVIYMSFLPILTEEYNNYNNFKNLLQKFADIIVCIGYIAVIGVLLFGNFAITLLYGEEFKQSAQILMIYIWSGVFTCLSYIGQAYFIIKGTTKMLMYVQIIGAILNVFLNIAFIPIMGMYGAAIATLLQYAIVAIGQAAFMWKRYGDLYYIEFKALIPFGRLIKLSNLKLFRSAKKRY